MLIINSRRDLEHYVAEHVDYDTSREEILSIVQTICDDDHPRYGDDWSEYLQSLPGALEELV